MTGHSTSVLVPCSCFGFRPSLIPQKGHSGMEVCLGPATLLDGDPAPPKGAQSPNFRPMSVVAKRSPISATAENMLVMASAC